MTENTECPIPLAPGKYIYPNNKHQIGMYKPKQRTEVQEMNLGKNNEQAQNEKSQRTVDEKISLFVF